MGELLDTDWGRYIAGGAVLAALLFGLRMVLKASDWSIGAYRSAGDFDAERVKSLEAKVDELNERVDKLTSDYRRQRELKHDWRSFASSLIQERFAIRQFAEVHACIEIIALMDRLDEMRSNNPLMTDVRSIVDSDGGPHP